ncbi:hypothetical protein PUNSTDRAFT_142752 [Punctularia strigosozonata HHB-11173 SS5]|uniref:uncharacterized protein n=1 Tax=Punctularia strigosozonata (strain HHB-11173) TaxID=741275 RepID=UPI000441631F|nr:uncharacterized protein PUNSTDRAFT_142752 [Punctularia strigosozonata HHB-11173 SS5]EIN10829.1 hypothetical protein PUNSTDRAFT_142752 [Punctularia strigosozonata HHB-11173 SS5]
MATDSAALAEQYVAPPMTPEQEDAIIYTRITNDERALRRVIKKFHTYAAIAKDSVPGISSARDDARDAFLVELASFDLQLKKSSMVCEAEARQVEEYRRERQRIADEHIKLRGQIEQLKTSLEHAQMLRRRKMEYDQVAEKINALPSRDELQETIASLESDMATIHLEHEAQEKTLQAQRDAIHDVVADLSSLRLLGKDGADLGTSRTGTPTPDGTSGDHGSAQKQETPEVGAIREEKEDGEDSSSDGPPSTTTANSMNPYAKPFSPGSVAATNRLLRIRSTASGASGSAAPSLSPMPFRKLVDDDDDIEMGEVAEDGEERRESRRAKKKAAEDEEPEEGEATDASSELSEPPDD